MTIPHPAAGGTPIIVVISDSLPLVRRVEALASAAGAFGRRLPPGFYPHAYARTLMHAGAGRRPAGCIIDLTSAVPRPTQLAEQLGQSEPSIPAVLVVPAGREEVVRRATHGGTVLGVVVDDEAIEGMLRERIGRMLAALTAIAAI